MTEPLMIVHPAKSLMFPPWM